MKIAVVGSRHMSDYGREVVGEIMEVLAKEEVVTIRVMGCNSEVIRLGAKRIFEGVNFEKLNEDVANYADILVIIEGGKKSGTLLLASKFVEKGKYVYCVPGRIVDEGSYATNWLIKQGAIPLVEMNDLTEVLQ
ncbi:MAG: protecting protein DprA protein [Candidatus Shapirobacteria bacterium GW2011_GWE1_38_10]|uniref:Protecting protein DprA protein n=1 Tax=Candidatus Shapirobacteria bacterium GW2011_GWE1_38_10 TaxID=1618488 RepID=A0A0G0KJ54_9BACT|nr:MAG: protecting protein DprA protein [Candidatus Shapirobacteria bacterium GW2011_GWF2_37_20]KKQ49224.1 MAG: protecting protein DprA protein [Candidatus Shapirobacteria bacterium GW2011_GWE1_38_10]KKQ64909.1 MAG: protecting protein DprA protein [Candidatus Shapirobacteria bacterium GW2011_GWF1_38_23]